MTSVILPPNFVSFPLQHIKMAACFKCCKANSLRMSSPMLIDLFRLRARRHVQAVRNMSNGKAEKCFQAMTEFYLRKFGKEWWGILEGMQLQKSHCALINTMLKGGMNVKDKSNSTSAVPVLFQSLDVSTMDADCMRSKANKLTCLKIDGREFDHPSNHKDRNGKMEYFLMDLSSLIPVLALDIQESDFVLDMCASPGGKTLAIALQLSDKGQLVSNEYDTKRRKRLHKVLDEYFPESFSRCVKVTNWNGKLFGDSEPNAFDKVLLDAPCSSDRHLVQDQFRHSGWSMKKSREFAELQKQLLLSAIRAVKVGGTVVYSTCTLSPFENDDVINWAVTEASNMHGFKVQSVNFCNGFNLDEFCISDTVRHGLLVTPSKTKNWGPMFTSKLLKVA